MSGDRQKRKSGTEPVDQLPGDEIVFGRSRAMSEVRQRAEKTAGMNVPVLLEGPGGTGKEVLARWIHSRSPWRGGQFVKVNCAAIPATLLESELFGYEKGAFTGAYNSKPGRLELAQSGTLFLDEITELPIGLQSKLLHFLQDGRFSRIGDETERRVETRLICATNKVLEQEIDAGHFRVDLYYRINVVRIKLPRLLERQEDIPLLAGYFLELFQTKFQKKAEPLGRETLQYLQNMDWPGNIRELSNGIVRYVLFGPNASMVQEQPARRPVAINTNNTGAGTISLRQIAREAIRDKEKNLILEALRANQWNRRRTAKALKISYRALIYKIQNGGLHVRGGRGFASAPRKPGE